MKVSICIPTFNSSEGILPTLEAIESCIFNIECKETAEILVIGSACSDDTRRVVEAFWSKCNPAFTRRFVDEDRAGAAVARLRAFHETTSELLIYCDDDVKPDPGAIPVIINTVRTEKNVGGGGGVILAELLLGSDWPEWLDWRLRASLALRDPFEGPVYSPPNEHARWYPVSAFVWFRRQSLLHWAEAIGKQNFVLGPTGKKMWRADDLEMDYYVLDAGYQIKLDPAIKAYHRIPPSRLSPNYFRSLMYWVGRSMQRLRNRRNPKAWNYSFGFLLSKFKTAPLTSIRQFGSMLRPVERRLCLDKANGSEEVNRIMHRAYQIGTEDEIFMRFLVPWRF